MSVMPSYAGAASTRLRLSAAIVLGLLCAIGAIVMLDPLPFSAEAAPAVSPCPTVVSTTNDSGPGSLRAALACVTPNGTVTFAPALAGQTILLTTTELAVAQSNITIDGSSAPGIKVDGNSAHRVFNVSAPLSTIALTVQHGSAFDGGGLLSSSALTLTGVTFLSNTATDNGGAVNAGGTALLNGGLFQGNSAANWGAGLYANTAIVLTGTQFLSNTATGLGGGAFAADVAALTGVLFQGNNSSEGFGTSTAKHLRATYAPLMSGCKSSDQHTAEWV